MEINNLRKNLDALKAFYPGNTEGELRHLGGDVLKGLPTWIKESIQLYGFPLEGLGAPLYLAVPKENITLEHLTRIYRQLAEKLDAHIIVIADHMPPKHRPLLVKYRIPFIYKDESIFVPELGLKFGKLKKFEPKLKFDLENKKETLTPFALKIVAGLLTNKIPQEFTHKFLHQKLSEQTKLSSSKLNPILNELAANGFLLIHGSGPTKTYTKNETQKIWEKTLATSFAPFFREVQTNYIPNDRSAYSIAGETALAQYSNLASPKQPTIAMTAGEFRNVYQGKRKDTIPFGDFDKPSVVQIWKEDPHLFSSDGVMNPIEVFFSMKNHPDDRVQIALDEMLNTYGLTRNKE
tara:strand:+ start:1104 stop:2153 length:1050 start_codon:yes stop_codon:yes gene_type:complete